MKQGFWFAALYVEFGFGEGSSPEEAWRKAFSSHRGEMPEGLEAHRAILYEYNGTDIGIYLPDIKRAAINLDNTFVWGDALNEKTVCLEDGRIYSLTTGCIIPKKGKSWKLKEKVYLWTDEINVYAMIKRGRLVLKRVLKPLSSISGFLPDDADVIRPPKMPKFAEIALLLARNPYAKTKDIAQAAKTSDQRVSCTRCPLGLSYSSSLAELCQKIPWEEMTNSQLVKELGWTWAQAHYRRSRYGRPSKNSIYKRRQKALRILKTISDEELLMPLRFLAEKYDLNPTTFSCERKRRGYTRISNSRKYPAWEKDGKIINQEFLEKERILRTQKEHRRNTKDEKIFLWTDGRYAYAIRATALRGIAIKQRFIGPIEIVQKQLPPGLSIIYPKITPGYIRAIFEVLRNPARFGKDIARVAQTSRPTVQLARKYLSLVQSK